MFSDPFLHRVAVTVGKGSGYARLKKMSGRELLLLLVSSVVVVVVRSLDNGLALTPPSKSIYFNCS